MVQELTDRIHLNGLLKKLKNESTDLHLGMESQHCCIGALVLDPYPERSSNHSIVLRCQMHLDSQADILKVNCDQKIVDKSYNSLIFLQFSI